MYQEAFFVHRGRTQTIFLCTDLKPDKRQQIITQFFIFVIEHTKLLNLSLVQIVRLFGEQNRAFSQAGCLSEEKKTRTLALKDGIFLQKDGVRLEKAEVLSE